MKENWEYKTLDEVCDINFGTRVVQKEDAGSLYDVYGGGGATFKMDRYNREDCFIVSRFAMSPKCTRYVKGKFFLNDSGLSVSSCDVALQQKFVDKFLLANNDKIYSLGKGAAQRNLDVKAFRNMDVPIPPLDEQEQIVAELDLLSGVIDKQKAELKELDNLAQSTFYDMFGDPIDNPNGWEVNVFGNVCDIICGQDYKSVQDDNGEYPVYGSGGIMTRANSYRCPENSVVLGRKGNINDPIFVREKFWNVDTAFGFVARPTLNPLYLFFFCKNYDFNRHNVAVTIPSLRRIDILQIEIPVPPLALQQSFADKITSIEKQKAVLTQSIAETQKLLDYTMDKYFG